MSKWVSIEDAQEKIVDNFLSNFDFLEAWKFSFNQLVDDMRSGVLTSRTVNPEIFSLVLSREGEKTEINLQDGNIIPPLFWEFWKESCEKISELLVEDDYIAESLNGRFRFKCPGLRDGRTLTGCVGGVEVLRGEISALPRGRGRPGVPKYDYREIVRRAHRAISLGLPRKKVIRKFAPFTPGNGTADSKVSTLRAKLREMEQADLKSVDFISFDRR